MEAAGARFLMLEETPSHACIGDGDYLKHLIREPGAATWVGHAGLRVSGQILWKKEARKITPPRGRLLWT